MSTIVETYLTEAQLAELAYTDLNKDLTASQYLARLQGIHDNDRLTGGEYEGDGISTFKPIGDAVEQAKILKDTMAFAGIEEVDGEYKFIDDKGYQVVDSYTD